jgi:protein phosphatase
MRCCRKTSSLDIVGKQLIELANDQGGRDNVSVQLAQVITPFTAQKGLFAKLANLFRT